MSRLIRIIVHQHENHNTVDVMVADPTAGDNSDAQLKVVFNSETVDLVADVVRSFLMKDGKTLPDIVQQYHTEPVDTNPPQG